MEGKGYIIKDESLKVEGRIVFEKPKSYSIIAMNLETVEDVEKVIRQCELVKEQMTGELVDSLKIRQFVEVPPVEFTKSTDIGDYCIMKQRKDNRNNGKQPFLNTKKRKGCGFCLNPQLLTDELTIKKRDIATLRTNCNDDRH